LTLSRLQWLFYGVGNIRPFLAISTTWAEKRVGFWLSYTVAAIITFSLPVILASIQRRVVRISPDSREFSQAIAIVWITLKTEKWRIFYRHCAWEVAKPSSLANRGVVTSFKNPIDWTDNFTDRVGQTAAACQIFFFFIMYNLTGGGLGGVTGSQASTLMANGVPNDLLGSINSLTTVVVMPIRAYVVFPLLRKCGFRGGRIVRMTGGFVLGSVASFYGAMLQWRIYETSPCGYMATGCEIGSGVTSISVWVQSPLYVINAISQLLTWVSAYEVAYFQSPTHLKAVTLAIFGLITVFCDIIRLACAPVISDPNLIWAWAVPGFVNLITTAIFYWKYRHYDDEKLQPL
jgi:dipeptide/tripeptide permease